VSAVAAITMMGCGGGGGGSDGPLTCLDSYLGAATISATNSTAATPTAAGLTISAAVDGTYFHTATTRFEQATAGPDARQYQGVIVISGDQVAVHEVNDELSDPLSAAGTYSISGTNLVLNATCYGGQAVTRQYMFRFTADASSIKLYQSHEEMVFTLQRR
jgi:hypothetical protein